MDAKTGRGRSRILIVDDEFGLAEMLREVLAEEGYDAILAMNGRRALEALEEQPVDVVLTDVMMPVMDGPALAAALRADARWSHIPIVFMTSLKSAVPAAGDLYDAVLHKPFTPERLFATLADVRDRARRTASGDEGH